MATSDLRWHPEAVEDALECRDWYAKRSPLAARGFLLALEHAVCAVIENPLRYRKGKLGCYEYVFANNYPFTLVYRQLRDELVEIVAVAHQRRRPFYWRGR